MSDLTKIQSIAMPACNFCKTGPIEKIAYVSHILGKRHKKTVSNIKPPPTVKDTTQRTVHVSGYDDNTPVETVLGVFWMYQIRSISYCKAYSFIEFNSRDTAQKVMKGKFVLANKTLKISARRMPLRVISSTPADYPSLSRGLENGLKRIVSAAELDSQIYSIINEIELRPDDYRCRDYLRKNMVAFLLGHFNNVSAYVFGSSANNLGFIGCDVDLYVDLGVDPWAEGTKAEMESRANDLTWYLAREIKRTRRGMNVSAVGRARVPIVKFTCGVTKLQVDLSFKNGMPVYNTALICQYTRTHYLVRPYLMLIRYWAKIQGVSGGGQPATLITNYAFTMLMLFYLMSRSDPIVPSVAHLKRLYQGNVGNECFIGGWDCGFGRNVNEWSERRHNTSVIQLVTEFFEYFAKYESKKWMISPLAGVLIEREAITKRVTNKLPNCMSVYCNQDGKIQADTALCVQDPFEHVLNITRGLRQGPLEEFQLKCRKAAEICRNIQNRKESLGKLLDLIELSDEDLTDSNGSEEEEGKEVDRSQEVITLDDSDADVSQDSIEILDIPKKNGEKGPLSPVPGTSNSEGKGGEVIELGEVMILDKENPNEDKAVTNGMDDKTVISLIKDGAPEKLDQTLTLSEKGPEEKFFKFPLDFTSCIDFTVTFDGELSGGKGVMTEANTIGTAACSFLQFILQQILKIDTLEVEVAPNNRKRKSSGSDKDDADSGKRRKVGDGTGMAVTMKYKRIVQYECSSDSKLWIGRKKISKKVPQMMNSNPLRHEMAITEMQIEANKELETISADILSFTIGVWQEVENPCKILVTADTRSTKGHMMTMFIHLTSLAQMLLKRVMTYVATTSTKR